MFTMSSSNSVAYVTVSLYSQVEKQQNARNTLHHSTSPLQHFLQTLQQHTCIMRFTHTHSRYVHDINWGARNVWSSAPQLMSCN